MPAVGILLPCEKTSHTVASLSPEQDTAVQERWGKEDFQKKLERAFWMNHPIVGQHLNRLATGRARCDWLTWFTRDCVPNDAPQDVLVLGCGEGWLERSIANLPWIRHIDARDVAEGAVERARELAAHEGIENITYSVLDLNTGTLPSESYDVVIAHSVLHHIEGLEHAFDTIRRSLRPAGWVAISEYIGPPHLQYGEEAMAVMNAVMTALAPRLRVAITSGELLEAKVRPNLDYILEVDPSEGVRADELDHFIRQNFSVVYEAPMGGTVLQHLLWELVANFDPDDPVDNCLLRWICLLEESLCEANALPSDYHFYVCRPKEHAGKEVPIGIVDVVPDPKRVRSPVEVEWRQRPAAREHFHRLATGNAQCDWLTEILAELECNGLTSNSKILWVGEDAWPLVVLRARFGTVTRYRKRLLFTAPRTFDAAFCLNGSLLNRANRRSLAVLGLVLSKTGALVAIEDRKPDSLTQTWVDRFAVPLAQMVESQPGAGEDSPCGNAVEIPAECTEGRESWALPDLFEVERSDALGGDLVEPIMDAYWKKIPGDRRDEVLRLLAVAETEGITRKALVSRRQGVLLLDPRTKPLLKALLQG